MTKREIVLRTQEHIKKKFSSESSGHDYWHMRRVWRLAKHIAKQEKDADLFTVELAALLHDIADFKFHDGDEEAGPRAAREWLKSLKVDNTIIEHVEDIIRNISFKGANVESKLATIEGQIVHDADKLDAVGAIGIARTFAYGGFKGRPIHDPNRSPEQHGTSEAYKNDSSPTTNHFYENHIVAGAWTVDDEIPGICCRESPGRVTNNTSYFLPHRISAKKGAS